MQDSFQVHTHQATPASVAEQEVARISSIFLYLKVCSQLHFTFSIQILKL